MISLILFPTKKLLIICLFNISLTFFFFGYHVHEKTIIVPLLIILVGYKYYGRYAIDFCIMATFVMYHMLKEDGLAFQYFAYIIAYAIICYKINSLLSALKIIHKCLYKK